MEEVCPKVEEVCPKIEDVCPKVEEVCPKVEVSKPEELKEPSKKKLKELKIDTSIAMTEPKPEPKDQNKVVEEILNTVINNIEAKPEQNIPIDRNEFAQPKQKKNKGAFKK